MATGEGQHGRDCETHKLQSNRPAPQFLGQPRTTVLRLPTSVRLRASSEMFWQICCENPDLRLERTASGRLEVLPPVGAMTGAANFKLTARLGFWNRATGLGAAFGSDLGYTLPSGAVRSPDASWIPLDQFCSLTPEQHQRFVPFAPTFAAELRSPGDRLANLRRKMLEYREQGANLGWLIDLVRKRVEIYRAEGPVEILDQPSCLSGENVLPGFELDLTGILADALRF